MDSTIEEILSDAQAFESDEDEPEDEDVAAAKKDKIAYRPSECPDE